MTENPAGNEASAAEPGITRRRLLQGAAGAAGALSAGGLLAACGGASSSSAGSPATGPVKRGGSLTVGMQTGGPGEVVIPFRSYQYTDDIRNAALYEDATRMSESFVPNGDATSWTLKLKDGVEFHNGKTLTADDVIYSLKVAADPKSYGAPLLTPLVDIKNVRKRDALTVEIPCLIRVADLPAFFVDNGIWWAVVPDGATVKELAANPIGTGPFKYESFTPGKTSLFTAFENYHVSGLPYLDTLIVNSSFTDDESRVNALAAGSIQAASQLPYAIGANPPSTFKVNAVASAAAINPIIMHVDTAPFDDVRVRQALRLGVDRKAWLESVYSGLGTIQNDTPYPSVEYHNDSLRREQDLDQARSLLKAAGKSDLTITLHTGAAFAGMVESATLFKQQMTAIGVTVNLKQIQASQYFIDFLDYPMGYDIWNGFSTQAPWYTQVMTTTAPYRESRFGSKATDKLIYDAVGELDEAKAQDKWNAVQQEQFDEGGYIIPTTFPILDGLAHNVQLKKSNQSWLNNWDLKEAWLSA